MLLDNKKFQVKKGDYEIYKKDIKNIIIFTFVNNNYNFCN